MRRLGFYLSPTPQHDSGFERALWAEAQGFDDVWFPDGDGMCDSITLAALVASRTRRIRLCTGIVPVYTRPPAILGTSVLAINRVAPGRFVLGLGSSTHAMVEGWYGIPFEKPLTRVRETVELLREILAGRKTRYEGRTLRSHGFRLKEPIVGEVPIFLAAMGPKMLELAGELADGVILNHFTPVDRLGLAREHIERGARRAGRRVEDIEIAQRVCVWVTDEPERAREFYRTDFSFYGSTEIYQNIIRLMGYPEAADGLKAGFQARDRQRIMASVPDEAVERLYVWGDAATCRERLRAFWEGGVDTVVIAPQATDPADFEATCDALTPAGLGLPGAGAVGERSV